MPLLVVENLSVFYGSIEAVRGISLRVEEGEVVTLIGANGAGKSTTLRTISGLIEPKRGSIQFAGQAIQGWAPHRVVKSGLVQVPEGREIFANLTVDENLQLAAFLRKDKVAIRADRERALDLFPRVRERLRQQAGTLSGGEQQMLAIARALVARPKLLMLDEPSLGLAPQLVRSIFQVIREINREGTTILLVEQNANMALQVANRAYVIEVGEIRMEGLAAELAASDEVRKAYLGAH
jgi:branched-chain amino acid transport system ATP-binding protein